MSEMKAKPTVPVNMLTDTAAMMRLSLAELRAALKQVVGRCLDTEDEDLEMNSQAARLSQGFYQLLRLMSSIELYATLAESTTDSVSHVDDDIVALCERIYHKAKPFFMMGGMDLNFVTNCRTQTIAFDKSLLERAILNLFENAMRASEKGTVVTLSVWCDEEEVSVSVSDTGYGVEEKRLAKIFERKPLTLFEPIVGFRGLGLGLPLCRMIAELHEGSIRMESALDQGTTVTITLPNRRAKVRHLHQMEYDYAGGYNHVLVEMSNVLPEEAYLME